MLTTAGKSICLTSTNGHGLFSFLFSFSSLHQFKPNPVHHCSLNLTQAQFWTSWAHSDLHCHIQVICQSFPKCPNCSPSQWAAASVQQAKGFPGCSSKLLPIPRSILLPPGPGVRSQHCCLSVLKCRGIWWHCSDSNAIRRGRLHPSVHWDHSGLPYPVHTGIAKETETQRSHFCSHQATSTFPSAYPVPYQQAKGYNKSRFVPTVTLYVFMRTKLFTPDQWITSTIWKQLNSRQHYRLSTFTFFLDTESETNPNNNLMMRRACLSTQ